MNVICSLLPCIGGSDSHPLFTSQKKSRFLKRSRRNNKFDYLRRKSAVSTARSSNNANAPSSNFFSMPLKTLKKVKELFSGTGNKAVATVAIGDLKDLKHQEFDYVWSRLKTAHREALEKLNAEASANQAKGRSASKTKASSSQNEIILEDEPVPLCLSHRLVKGKIHFEWSKKSPAYQKDMAAQVMLNDLWKKKTGRQLKELFSKTVLTLENMAEALEEHEAAIKNEKKTSKKKTKKIKTKQRSQSILRNNPLWKAFKKLTPKKNTVGVANPRRT